VQLTAKSYEKVQKIVARVDELLDNSNRLSSKLPVFKT